MMLRLVILLCTLTATGTSATSPASAKTSPMIEFVAPIEFKPSTARLLPKARPILDDVAVRLFFDCQTRVMICINNEDASENALIRRRIRSIKSYLSHWRPSPYVRRLATREPTCGCDRVDLRRIEVELRTEPCSWCVLP